MAKSKFDYINKLTFVDDGEAWKEQEENGWPNVYNTLYDGSINVTNVYRCETIYTKPHFLDFANTSILPEIVNHHG